MRDRKRNRVSLDSIDEKGSKNIVSSMYIFVFLLFLFYFGLMQRLNQTILNCRLYIFTICFIPVLLWSFIIIVRPQRFKSSLLAYLGIFSMYMFIGFFLLYYIQIYEILHLTSYFYIILPLIGYVVFVVSLLFYLEKHSLDEKSKRVNSPKYGLIASGTIIGGTLIKILTSRVGSTGKELIASLCLLVLVYFFGIIVGVAGGAYYKIIFDRYKSTK